jgi:hypothetical protein
MAGRRPRSFIGMLYTYGSTEPGSSGSPLLTCENAGAGCDGYAVRGPYGRQRGLRQPAGIDMYSRLDLAYPYIAKFLAPNAVVATGPGRRRVLQCGPRSFFRNGQWRGAIGIEGGSAGSGWFRTGYAFNTLAPTQRLVCPSVVSTVGFTRSQQSLLYARRRRVPVPEGLAGGAAADTAAMELREYCVLERPPTTSSSCPGHDAGITATTTTDSRTRTPITGWYRVSTE